MKKVAIMSIMILMTTISISFAQQKYGYVYSQQIFEKIDSYKNAVTELSSYAEKGRKEADNLLHEAKESYKVYQRNKGSLSEYERSESEKLIVEQERRANEFETKFFGDEGMLNKKQKELLGPIESKVLDAVNAIAKEDGYGMIFDLSVAKVTVYQSPGLNLTSKVLSKLGLK